MIVRRIQLKNNLYMDKNKVTNKSGPLGEYCVFGYFDAMNISNVYRGQISAWEILSEGVIEEMDGRCAVRSLLCVSGDQEKDAEFWLGWEMRFCPLLFVSIIRLKEPIDSSYVIKEMNEINQNKDEMTYFSYEHSELIVFKKTSLYSEGHAFSEKLHQSFQIYKMYTIFSVKEEALESYITIENKIKKESVDCRLRAIVKDWGLISEMEEKLQKALDIPQISGRRMMGNTDVLFEINNVSLHRLLACYKMNELLTHSNLDYQKVFYNVETEIL